MPLTVTDAFKEFKSSLGLNKTFQAEITTHHNAVRSWVESFDSNIETKLIGSLSKQKQTKIQPLEGSEFDIDILVVLGKFYGFTNDGISPADAMNKLEGIISYHESYQKMGPETDSPTITFNYSNGVKVELVPAYRDFVGEKDPKGRGYYIPMNNKWVLADYDFDADFISKMNTDSDGYLIPIIKMLKAAKRNIFPDMKSYHLEVLTANLIPQIVNYLKEKGEPLSYPLLIYGFFLCAQEQIKEETIVSGSKSPPADRYMVPPLKQVLANFFKKISDHCKNLLSKDDSSAIEGWRLIFGDPFPHGG